MVSPPPAYPCPRCGRHAVAGTAVCPSCGQPEPAGPGYAPPYGGRPGPRPQAPARSVWLPVLLAAIAVLLLALALGAVLLLRAQQRPSPAPAPAPATQVAAPPAATATTPTTPTTEATTSPPATSPSRPRSRTTYGSTVQGSLVGYASASASSTSKDSFDGFQNRTTFDAENMLDEDPFTCWRMDGKGTSATLTFRLDQPRPITTLGLVNGYAKVDPATGEDRYYQERRITRVTWTVNGQDFVQNLQDYETRPQQFTLPQPLVTSRVRLRINRVTAPGDRRFDRTAISDVVIANL